jgi:hypothetical protein
MASAKKDLDTLRALRLATPIAYSLVSVLVIRIVLSESEAVSLLLPLIPISLVFVAGLVTRRPDLNYLAWLLLGTTTLVAEAESAWSSILILAVTVVLILVMADVLHLVAIVFPRGEETIDRVQLAVRLKMLRKRALFSSAIGAGSIFLSLTGASLIPAFVVPSAPVLIIGVLTIAALALMMAVASGDRWSRE